MQKLKVTREQVLDTSKGFCIACGKLFEGYQSEHVTTRAHESAVRTFEDSQTVYYYKARR